MNIEKPKDWNDHEGWETYFSSLFPEGDYADECTWIGSIPLENIETFATELKENNLKKVWFAGCGISLLPKALSQRGFEVYATDISPTALKFQNSDDNNIQKLIDEKVELEIDSSGSLNTELHDFREHYKENFFDLIINTKALQGFDKPTMDLVAKTHFEALKQGCQAIFDTINVQGEHRDLVESYLVKVGFLIPFYELNCWYRNKLNETKLPYVFILGNPILPATGVYSDSVTRDEDMKVLQKITTEYREIQQAELEKEQAKLADPKAKIASIIYSTG